MITIKNTQRHISMDNNQIRRDAQKILAYLEYEDFDLGIWFTTEPTIKRYNAHYRHKNKPTDILSFPYHPDLNAGERIEPKTIDDKNLGDLIMAPAYIQKAAQELGVSFEKRMRVLLAHGICHLLGYDHIKDNDYEIMHQKELELLGILEK